MITSLPKDKRTRNWTIIVYPESAPQDWRSKLDGMLWVESPLHDSDLNSDNSPKKPHWHILLTFDGKKSYKQVKEISDSVNGASPQYVQDITGMLRYFAHLDNPEKAQYDKSLIKGHGIDVSYYLDSADDVDKMIMEIEKYCEDKGICEYSILTAVSRQYENWHKCVSTHTIHFSKFLESLRHS